MKLGLAFLGPSTPRLMTDMPLMARGALVHAHRRPVLLHQNSGVRLSLRVIRVALLGLTRHRRVRAGTTAQGSASPPSTAPVTTRPIEDGENKRNGDGEDDHRAHEDARLGIRE